MNPQQNRVNYGTQYVSGSFQGVVQPPRYNSGLPTDNRGNIRGTTDSGVGISMGYYHSHNSATSHISRQSSNQSPSYQANQAHHSQIQAGAPQQPRLGTQQGQSWGNSRGTQNWTNNSRSQNLRPKQENGCEMKDCNPKKWTLIQWLSVIGVVFVGFAILYVSFLTVGEEDEPDEVINSTNVTELGSLCSELISKSQDAEQEESEAIAFAVCLPAEEVFFCQVSEDAVPPNPSTDQTCQEAGLTDACGCSIGLVVEVDALSAICAPDPLCDPLKGSKL